MSETLILIAAVIVAALLGYTLARVRGREGVVGQGRLTLDSQPNATTAKIAVTPSSNPSALADAVESAIASLPESVAAEPLPGIHMSIKANVKMIFKLPSKEAAEAVAERERAKGMSVVVTPPDATDQNWRVTSTK
jgi:hypothetical protein